MPFSHKSPKCIYGHKCYAVCINPQCKKYGFICQNGYLSKQQCYLFHQKCQHLKWTEMQKITSNNPFTNMKQFKQIKIKIQKMFIHAIQKIKQQQKKFRIWVKTYGYSLQIMKFLKIVTDQDYDQITGSMVAPVINSYFKQTSDINKVNAKTPSINQQVIRQVQLQIQNSIKNITSLYLRTNIIRKKNEMKNSHHENNSTINNFSFGQFNMNSMNYNFLSQPNKDIHNNLSNSLQLLQFPSNNPLKTKNISDSLYSRQQSKQKMNTSKSDDKKQQVSPLNLLVKSSKYTTDKLQRNNNHFQQKQFNKNMSELSRSPQLKINQLQLNSKIYTNIQNINRLLFNKRKVKSFKLIYRASQYSYSIQQFHKRCDNVSNTFILVQTQFNKIIGGYTNLEWKSNKKQWVADKQKQSFIFSLALMEKYHLNLPQFAISNNAEKGPIFGCCDISIVDKSNKQKSSAQFPISYNVQKKYQRGDQASLAFTGHPKGQYRTKQWQVFKVQYQ